MGGRRGVSFQLVKTAAVVHHVELTGMIFTEADDLQRRVHQFLKRGEFVAIAAQRPDFARDPIAVNVSAHQVL